MRETDLIHTRLFIHIPAQHRHFTLRAMVEKLPHHWLEGEAHKGVVADAILHCRRAVHMSFGTSKTAQRVRRVVCLRAKTAWSSADAQRWKPVMSGSMSLKAGSKSNEDIRLGVLAPTWLLLSEWQRARSSSWVELGKYDASVVILDCFAGGYFERCLRLSRRRGWLQVAGRWEERPWLG